MNQLVNDLAEHADFYVGNEHSDKSHEERQRLFMEHYTHLVIQEATTALNPMLRDMISRGQAVSLIKHHFSVGEEN